MISSSAFDLKNIYQSVRADGRRRAHPRHVEFVMHATEYALLAGGTHLYDDPYLVLQLNDGSQGYCFVHPGEVDNNSLKAAVGLREDAPPEDGPPWAMAILVDAFLGPVPPTVSHDLHHLQGDASAKSLQRAHLVASMVPASARRVGVLGGIEDIVRALAADGRSIQVADFHLQGRELAGCPVSGDFRAVLGWCDYALITGNVLKTDTLTAVVDELNSQEKLCSIYAMTGHNLYPRILSDLPCASASVETFPFYWYSGSSEMRIYTSKANLKPSVW